MTENVPFTTAAEEDNEGQQQEHIHDITVLDFLLCRSEDMAEDGQKNAN